MSGSVLCVTLNPVLDTSYFVEEMRPIYRTEASRITYVAGGKGNNVARALTILGERAHSLVALGGMIGRDIAELMGADDYDSTPAWVSGESRLQITVIDAAGQQRAFYAPAAPLVEADAAVVRGLFQALLPRASAVCLCGSSPGGYSEGLLAEFLGAAKLLGLPSLLDSSGRALLAGLDAEPDIVKVNRVEAAGWVGQEIGDRAAELDILRKLRAAAGRWAVLTLGEQGALFAADDKIWHAAPPPVAAVHPIASGDAMTAGLISGLLAGLPAPECFRRGMAAAAANTLTWDACRFSRADVQRLVPEVALTLL